MSEFLHTASAEENSASKKLRIMELNTPNKGNNYPLKEVQLSALKEVSILVYILSYQLFRFTVFIILSIC